ncbi:MAG: menA, partial [Nocardia sp.]|nr:menA [Nocardia sp.]
FLATLALAARTPWALVGLVALPLALKANEPVRTGKNGPGLIPALAGTGLALLIWSIATGLALGLG